MTPAPQTIRDDKRLRAVQSILEWGHFRHLPVVDAKGQLCGLLSQTDLLAASASVVDPSVPRAQRELQLASVAVADVMQREVVTVHPDEPVQVAALRMRQHKIHCLPVVDGVELVGIVTAFDLLGVVAASLV